ncbi:hypothetical protein BKA62DRAFT_59121 [Auriculariales sp. MPI-PUGE-AT-0066]|nr:hypothetical protein BKA62DRAFT_59121 [Auriculariales sp. MPI-PUGE-AT-0066]
MLAQHRLSRASSIGSDSRYPVPNTPSYEFGAMMGPGNAGSRNSTHVSTPRNSSYGTSGSTSRPQSFVGRPESGYFSTTPPMQSTSTQMVSSPLAIDARIGSSGVAFPPSQSTPLDAPVAPGLRSGRVSSEVSTPSSASPLYRQSAAISNPSIGFAPYTIYSNAPEPDDELHAPEKYDVKSGRPSKGPMHWSYRGMANVITLLVATVGIAALFIVYPITNHLSYAARVSRMEGLGLALPHFNASGQLDLGGLHEEVQSSSNSRSATILPTTVATETTAIETTTTTTETTTSEASPSATLGPDGTDGTTTGDTAETTPPDDTAAEDGTTTGDDTIDGTVPRLLMRRQHALWTS